MVVGYLLSWSAGGAGARAACTNWAGMCCCCKVGGACGRCVPFSGALMPCLIPAVHPGQLPLPSHAQHWLFKHHRRSGPAVEAATGGCVTCPLPACLPAFLPPRPLCSPCSARCGEPPTRSRCVLKAAQRLPLLSVCSPHVDCAPDLRLVRAAGLPAALRAPCRLPVLPRRLRPPHVRAKQGGCLGAKVSTLLGQVLLRRAQEGRWALSCCSLQNRPLTAPPLPACRTGPPGNADTFKGIYKWAW